MQAGQKITLETVDDKSEPGRICHGSLVWKEDTYGK